MAEHTEKDQKALMKWAGKTECYVTLEKVSVDQILQKGLRNFFKIKTLGKALMKEY